MDIARSIRATCVFALLAISAAERAIATGAGSSSIGTTDTAETRAPATNAQS